MRAIRATLCLCLGVFAGACTEADTFNTIPHDSSNDSPPPRDANPNGRCESSIDMASFNRPYDQVTKPNAPGTGITWPVFHRDRAVALAVPGTDAGPDGPITDAPPADAMTDAMTDAMADAGPDGGPPDAMPDAPPNDAPPTMGAFVGSFAGVELAEIDPATGAPIASSTNTCNASDMYLNLGDISVGDQAFAAIDHPMISGGTTTLYRLYHALPAGPEGGNILAIELWDMFGTYATGVHTGAVTIQGQEANFATCGACIIIYAKINSMNQYSQAYIATAGTLTIDGF